jgi:hypothetical protein
MLFKGFCVERPSASKPKILSDLFRLNPCLIEGYNLMFSLIILNQRAIAMMNYSTIADGAVGDHPRKSQGEVFQTPPFGKKKQTSFTLE